MIPELGQFALILALCLAVVQVVMPLLGTANERAEWMAFARPAAAGQFVFTSIAFAILAYAFVTNDFSVLYVAKNSNTALPTVYKVAAVWGGHEGSLLLWCLMLSLWTVLVAGLSRDLPQIMSARVLAVLGFVSIGVLLFTLVTSNPFERLFPAAFNGNDLNPLLQDPAMALHPPILYMGYVGFSVAFAFAVAALISGRFDADWARWMRRWTIWAWMFLTVGIALGSWWAYYELGWGGWWFWDPVENASFMPWLVGTALIHSLAVTEKRGLFKSWTLLLAIGAFSLSLLGTFLVRSGILISVHSFASDPSRGLFILALLTVITGGALVLYAWRAPRLRTPGGFKLVSREAFILLNNVLLVAAAILVLFGTLYPLFLDALGMGKISVGPPYFNTVFLIPMLPLVMFLGAGMHTIWKKMSVRALSKQLRVCAVLALAAALLLPWLWFGRTSILTTLGILAGMWVVFSSLLEPARAVRRGTFKFSRAQLGMFIAHLGVGMFVLGATVTSSFGTAGDFNAKPGDSIEIAGYELVFRKTRNVIGPNYKAIEGEFELRRAGKLITVLTPQKRTYQVQKSAMTEAAIDARWYRDVFVALGEPLGNDRWSLRVQYKPLLGFLWLGALIMALGGLLASLDRRYAQKPASVLVVDEPARLANETP